MSLNADMIREAARGMWRPAIYPALGITVRSDKRHSPCPLCGGRDRFRCDDRTGSGSWYCNQCDPHAGDGFALVQKMHGCDFLEALRLVAGILGIGGSTTPGRSLPRPQPPRPRPDRRRIALDFELYGIALQERAKTVLRAASSMDTSGWSVRDRDAAMTAIGKAHDDLVRAEVLFDVTDSQRMKAYKEDR